MSVGVRFLKTEGDDREKIERKVSRDEKNIEKDSQKLPKNKG